MTNKSLGRGLSAFLDLELSNSTNENDIIKIKLDIIKRNPFQPRQVFDEENLNSLADSIKRKGVLQPILVIKSDDGNYQLVAGERRLRASKIAGMKEIPAIITNMSKKEQLEVAILENIQRENLNSLEEAEAYKRLIEEFNHTQEELSTIVGKSRSHITNTLRILSLPEEVKNMLKEGKITFGHARALVGYGDSAKIAKQVVDQSLNVRQIENIVKQRKNRDNVASDYTNPEISNLASQISSLIGLSVNVKLKNKGGVIEINFNNFEELDNLIRKLNTWE